MNKIFALLIYFFFASTLYASINTINYQGLITDSSGFPVSSKYIGLQFRIIEGSSETPLFIEQTKVMTSEDGFINYKIGSESTVSLTDIDWSQENLLLEISIDLEGDQNYTSVITSSISSVPVSFFSLRSLDAMQQTEQINQLNLRLEQLEEKNNNPTISHHNNYAVFLISDCICIGDSVTEGHVYDYPKTPEGGKVDRNQSYPFFLTKMSGWNVENAGFSGFSASDWYEKKFNNYDYTKYDLAIIELGYNGGLSDTLNEDVLNENDYQYYSDTNTGSYCKIIEGIRTQNPEIKIVLNISSMMKEDESVNGVSRKVIKQIAEKYNLPIIDLNDKTFIDLNSEIYHGFTDSSNSLNLVHFNKTGYCAKASFIYNVLIDILSPSSLN